jgi:hypothetical protein
MDQRDLIHTLIVCRAIQCYLLLMALGCAFYTVLTWDPVGLIFAGAFYLLEDRWSPSIEPLAKEYFE